jgi:bifunctional non-homologous end joining protein LigD
MPLERVRHAFDHPEWLFELKYDGFRALAYVDGAGAQLVSRRGLGYRQFPDLVSELSRELNADEAVLDGEIVKLDESGRPIFVDLIRRRGPFAFVAFDVLALNGTDVRKLPLLKRKRLLRRIVPNRSSVILYASHVDGRGRNLFAEVCAQDLEGIVAKKKASVYDPTTPVSPWVKIKNRDYSQARDRHELFER